MNKIKEVLPEFAILKRITGLNTIKGMRSRPQMFSVSQEDYNTKNVDAEGEFISQYDNNVLPKATTRLSPFYNEIKGTYWEEDLNLLKQIITPDPESGWRGIRVRYPKGHYDEGKIINVDKIDPYNFYDAFFDSEELTSKVMRMGQYTFKNWKDPVDALLFLSYKNNPRVIVRDGGQLSTHKSQTALYEIVIPKMERTKSKTKLKSEFDAIDLLNKMSYEKRKAIAYVMSLRLDDYENPDPDALFLELGNLVKDDSPNKVSKWGMTKRDKFVSLAKATNSDLALEVDIKKAKDFRVIEKIRNEYRFNHELLESVHDDLDLFKYFKSKDNLERYNDLLYLVEEKSKSLA